MNQRSKERGKKKKKRKARSLNIYFQKYLMDICSRASIRVTDRPPENIASKRLRTWFSIASPIAFAKFPTQAKASGKGRPLRGPIYK